MSTVAGIVTAVMALAAALLLSFSLLDPRAKSGSADPAHRERKQTMRTLGISAAVIAVVAAYVAALF